mgnify:CR=1 FL=1
MALKDKNITIKDKLENLMHGHLSLEKEPLEIHLDGWYLTNKGNLCKAIYRYNSGNWKFLIQQEFGLGIYYCFGKDLQFLKDEWVVREAPRGKGRESLIKAIYTHPDYNKRILWEARGTRDLNGTWGRAFYVGRGALCKPSHLEKGESDDR